MMYGVKHNTLNTTNNQQVTIIMIDVMRKSTPSSRTPPLSIQKRVLLDIIVLSVLAIVFVKFYNPIHSALPPKFSEQSNRILQDQEIELNWERQHVFDLQQTLGKVSESQKALENFLR